MNIVIPIAMSLFAVVASVAAQADAPPIFGYLEKVLVGNERFPVQAKLDTGADNSSVHAENIGRFTRDDRPWVRFTITNLSGESQTLERPLVRIAEIKRHGAPSLARRVA